MKTNIINFKLDDNRNTEFKDLNFRFSEANKLFLKFKSLEQSDANEKELFFILKNIIELIDINPIYNYYFLKYHQNIKEYYSFNEITNQNNKFTYEDNYQKLKLTLNSTDYSNLTKEPQSNPAIDIFELIQLYLNDQYKFFVLSSNIIYHKFNFPLIESTERLRMLYYRKLFKKPEDNENGEEKKKFENICEGINSFKKLILSNKMKNWVYSINLDENKINKKFFVFMAYLGTINNFKAKDEKIIKRIYGKEFEPDKEVKAIKRLLNGKNKGILTDFDSDDDDEKFLITKIEILNEDEFKITVFYIFLPSS